MNGILGVERLTAVFGHWPTFHDAEVVRLVLDRADRVLGRDESPRLTVEIRAFEMTSEIGPGGTYVLRDESLVTLEFREVIDLHLTDFNSQNALFGLQIKDVTERQMERVHFEVEMAASYGLGATFRCYAVEVLDVQPWHERLRISPPAV